MTISRGTLLSVSLLLCAAASAAAQTPVSSVAPMPRAFIGAGIGIVTNDAGARMLIFEDGIASMWLVEAGAAVSKRVSLGVEFSRPSEATAATVVGKGTTQHSGRQTERLLLAMIRARAAGSSRVALDIVAGGGLLFQRHEAGSCIFAQPRCEDTSGDSLSNRSHAYVVGAEFPVRVGAHLEIVGSGRVYFLRRGVHRADPLLVPSWQFDWVPSSRTAAIIMGRVTW
jgi:hypothetical protein